MINMNKKFCLWFVIMVALFSCNDKCPEGAVEVKIYHGMYFKSGQSYSLSVDNGLYNHTRNFPGKWSRGEYKKITTYCSEKDSIKIEFTLDSNDTSFYMQTNRPRKLVVGSNAYGDFSIGTDEDESFWVGFD